MDLPFWLESPNRVTLDAPAIMILAERCAPSVHPKTMAAIVMAESSGDPLAINVNGTRNPQPATSRVTAIQTARSYIAAGYSVDLGLGQVNSRNLKRLGLTVEQMFQPCANLAASARILSANYRVAGQAGGGQRALRVAFSMYNTGHPARGFGNGYVARVERAGAAVGSGAANIPSAVAGMDTDGVETATVVLTPTIDTTAPRGVATVTAIDRVRPPTATLPAASPASWDVFALQANRRVVLFQSASR